LRAFGEGYLGIGAVLGVLMLAMSLVLHAIAAPRVKVLF